MIGKTLKCPHCQNLIEVPVMPSAVPRKPESVSPVARSLTWAVHPAIVVIGVFVLVALIMLPFRVYRPNLLPDNVESRAADAVIGAREDIPERAMAALYLLEKETSLSESQLQRKFAEYLGLASKLYSEKRSHIADALISTITSLRQSRCRGDLLVLARCAATKPVRTGDLNGKVPLETVLYLYAGSKRQSGIDDDLAFDLALMAIDPKMNGGKVMESPAQKDSRLVAMLAQAKKLADEPEELPEDIAFFAESLNRAGIPVTEYDLAKAFVFCGDRSNARLGKRKTYSFLGSFLAPYRVYRSSNGISHDEAVQKIDSLEKFGTIEDEFPMPRAPQ